MRTGHSSISVSQVALSSTTTSLFHLVLRAPILSLIDINTMSIPTIFHLAFEEPLMHTRCSVPIHIATDFAFGVFLALGLFAAFAFYF